MSIKKITIIIFSIASNQYHTLSPNDTSTTFVNQMPKTEAGHTFVFHIDNSARQQMGCRQSEESVACSTLWATDLKECILGLSNQQQKEAFKKLPAHLRATFIKNLTFQEYFAWINSYTDQMWQELYASLSPEEKKQWPQSRNEQFAQLEALAQQELFAALATEIALLTLDSIPGFQALHVAWELFYVAQHQKHPGADFYTTYKFKEFIKRHYGY